jgi:3-oxoacyl-[acyl-carrier-protein] synthase II
VISPIGIGFQEFTAGVVENRTGRKLVAPSGVDTESPCREACTIPEFDIAKILGAKKGTRVLDRTAALAVAATALAIRHAGINAVPGREQDFGVVLGTCNGTLSRTVEYTTETLDPDKPHLVSPEAFPNTVMNFAAGQCSIAHRLRALNTTISGGRLACILALRYACRMLHLGYAKGILVGSVEEYSAPMAWGARYAALSRNEDVPLLGEGCAMFSIEPSEVAEQAGRQVLGELLACEVGFCCQRNQDPAETLAACIARAMRRAGIQEREVGTLSVRDSGLTTLDGIETRALQNALSSYRSVRRIAIARQVGECFSASGALQLSALLATFASSPETRRRVGLLTSVTHGGGVGCALVRGV